MAVSDREEQWRLFRNGDGYNADKRLGDSERYVASSG